MPVMNGMELMQELNETVSIKRHQIAFILPGIRTNQRDVKGFQKLGVQF